MSTERGLIGMLAARFAGPAVALSLLATQLAGGRAFGESLEEALVKAYQTNPQLLAERAHLRATDEGVAEALSNWRPTVEASGGAGYDKVTTPNTKTLGLVALEAPNGLSGSSQSWDARITQPIYRGGRTVAQTEEAELSVRAARAQLQETEATILFEVAEAYLDCVRDQDLYDIAVDNEQTLRVELEGSETQLTAGTFTQPDKLQVEEQYATAAALRRDAQAALESSRDLFLRVVGDSPGKLATPTLHPKVPASREEALRTTLELNPTIISSQHAADAASKAIEVVKGQLLPTVSVVGEHSQYYTPPVAGIARSNLAESSVMATVTVPIYEAGAVYAQARQAQEIFQQDQHQADDLKRTAVQAVGQAWDKLTAERDTLPDLTHASNAAAGAFEGIKQEQLLGTRTMTDVLASEQVLFLTRESLITQAHDTALSEFALAMQLGWLTAAELGLKTSLYDVENHYRSVRDKWIGFGADDH